MRVYAPRFLGPGRKAFDGPIVSTVRRWTSAGGNLRVLRLLSLGSTAVDLRPRVTARARRIHA